MIVVTRESWVTFNEDKLRFIGLRPIVVCWADGGPVNECVLPCDGLTCIAGYSRLMLRLIKQYPTMPYAINQWQELSYWSLWHRLYTYNLWIVQSPLQLQHQRQLCDSHGSELSDTMKNFAKVEATSDPWINLYRDAMTHPDCKSNSFLPTIHHYSWHPAVFLD